MTFFPCQLKNTVTGFDDSFQFLPVAARGIAAKLIKLLSHLLTWREGDSHVVHLYLQPMFDH